MKRRKAFLMYVDLDAVPGAMHDPDSAREAIQGILKSRIPHYHPIVFLAPETLQPGYSESKKEK